MLSIQCNCYSFGTTIKKNSHICFTDLVCFEYSSGSDENSVSSCFNTSNCSSGIESELVGCASPCSFLSPVTRVELKVRYREL